MTKDDKASPTSLVQQALEVGAGPTTPAGLLCKRCGYDLRGLAAQGECPECALPILRSLGGDLLRDSSPEYLRQLVRGLRITFWGALASVLLPVAIGAAYLFASLLPVLSQAREVLLVCLFAAPAAVVLGWWLASAPDPGLPGSEQDHSRRMVRWTAAVVAGVLVLVAAVELAQSALSGSGGTLLTAAIVLDYLLYAASAGHWLASVFYLARLIDRVPDRDLRKACQRVQVAFVIAAAAIMLLQVLPASLPPAPGPLPVPLLRGSAELVAFVAPLYALLNYVGIIRKLVDDGREALLIATALDDPVT